jgi:hypothetical protein
MAIRVRLLSLSFLLHSGGFVVSLGRPVIRFQFVVWLCPRELGRWQGIHESSLWPGTWFLYLGRVQGSISFKRSVSLKGGSDE